MKTRGPRMNRERMREVVDKLKIRVLNSDGHGIEIKRVLGSHTGHLFTYEPQVWRVYTGGGIAGNSDSAWLRQVIGSEAPRGPFWNKGQLERALRAWRRGE